MTTQSPNPTIVADIGGTNTRLACANGAGLDRDTIRRFANDSFQSFEEVLAGYLTDMGTAPGRICISIAGPITGGTAALTNRDWRFSAQGLADLTGAETVVLLNDMQAQGHALGHIPADDLIQILPGTPAPQDPATRLVVNVGTGFNIAPIYDTPGGRLVPACEGGHATLPVQTAQDLDLARYLSRTNGFSDIEEALSGRGIENIYAWLVQDTPHPTLTNAEILTAYLAHDPLAITAFQTFTRLLGHVAGDFALSLLPVGGVFLTGGVSARLAPYFAANGFGPAFCAKGRFSSFMDQFAVTAVTSDDIALIGCAAYMARERG